MKIDAAERKQTEKQAYAAFFETAEQILPADSRYRPRHQPGSPAEKCTAGGQNTERVHKQKKCNDTNLE